MLIAQEGGIKLHIKTRMIINGVLTVTVSILLAIGIVYFLVEKQSRENAASRIGNPLQVVSVQMEGKKKALTIAAENLGKSESLNNTLARAADLVRTKGDLS
jgi:hypothetical protein